jgi:hypothetical protein
MKVGIYEFNHVCDLEPIRDGNGSVLPLQPMGRYQNTRGLPLNRYGKGPFCKFRIPNEYRMSGVYGLLVDEEASFRYVGECVHLSNRFNAGYGNISPRNCFKGGQETNCRLNNLIFETAQSGRRVSLWLCRTADHKTVEGALFGTLRLAWNL